MKANNRRLNGNNAVIIARNPRGAQLAQLIMIVKLNGVRNIRYFYLVNPVRHRGERGQQAAGGPNQRPCGA